MTPVNRQTEKIIKLFEVIKKKAVSVLMEISDLVILTGSIEKINKTTLS